MAQDILKIAEDYDPRIKVFHELMQNKVYDVLLVSTPYDAYIMEEDGRLAERIINEYRGLNLSRPPRLTWVSTAEEALAALDTRKFELVITMARLADMDPFRLGQEVKKRKPDLPVILLSHEALPPECVLGPIRSRGIDNIFSWTGNTDLVLALVKSAEDRLNVQHDTQTAGVRVILVIEDSPEYRSALLPLLYKVVVQQTQAVLEEGLNEEHRLLTMRARPKIMVADDYEEATALYEQYQPYLLGVISDTRFPKNCELNENAGVEFLAKIRSEVPDLPLLLWSSEPANRARAASIPASFIDKNSPSLLSEIRSFFLDYLGFGDFVFRMPDGSEIARVSNVRAMEKILANVPDESIHFHANRNDFSRWLFARSEILLAAKMRPITYDDLGDAQTARDFLIASLRTRRRLRQQGVVVDFDAREFDPETDFLKIGKGSLGGKARGLAFAATLLRRNPDLHSSFSDLDIMIPKTLVLTTDVFDTFIERNELRHLAGNALTDDEIAERFLNSAFPDSVAADLRAYLSQVEYPLAVRSSASLEDAQYRAYAGLYRTYMIPNCHSDIDVRLMDLIKAVKLVYASTYYQGPKSFAKRAGLRTEDEKMAVIIQQMVGDRYGDNFYPAIAGVAQSQNYYPFGQMKPEEGIATIALGLGKTVVEGGRALRFSPKYPQLLPQFSAIEDILRNSQQFFYSLKMGTEQCVELGTSDTSTLATREVSEATSEYPVQVLTSAYYPAEQRLVDGDTTGGHRILTFAEILKHKFFPLSDILYRLLSLAQEGMGCPVELEFSVNLRRNRKSRAEFAFLQLRPMTARAEQAEVTISDEEQGRAFCVSHSALGNADKRDISDILFVKPDLFDPVHTMIIAREIGKLNAGHFNGERPYLLIGPGRWGSVDRWLGIPVKWADIHWVGAIVETTTPEMRAEPSQGSHFFHNVTTMGINYFTVTNHAADRLDWDWLRSLPMANETKFVAHVRLDQPVIIKVDGRKSLGVILV